jgi:DNA-binding CsgD family transcriptional regulator
MSPPTTESGARRQGPDWPVLWFATDGSARVIVDRDLTLLSLNQKAESLLDSNGALGLRDGLLVGKDRKMIADLYTMVANAGREASYRALGAPEGASVLVGAVALDASTKGPVGLVLRDLAAPIEIECADLEPMFGVTPGEHVVVVQLLKGRSSREIADASGKSVLTVRTHVKRAYGKIGVKTRGQLFARLLPYLSIR